MKNLLDNKSNKKGQLSIALSLGIIVTLIVFVLIILIAFFIFPSVRYTIIGIGVFIAGLFIVGTLKSSKIKLILGLILFGIAIFFIFGIGFISQTTNIFTNGNYIETPTINYYECSPASEVVKTSSININTGSSGWITIPSSITTNSWDLIISQTEQTQWYSFNRRILYQICHSNGICENQVIVNGQHFSIFGNTIIPGIRVSNLLITDKIWANYQYQSLFSWKDKENGASYYKQYTPFILWINGAFIGRTEYANIKDGCSFGSNEQPNLINSITNAKISLTQTSNNNNILAPYKTRNYIGTFVTTNVNNINFVNYNGKSGYCVYAGYSGASIFAISEITTNDNTYKIVDTNFNTQLASNLACCPGQLSSNGAQKCNSNYQWKDISVAECSTFNSCAGIDWAPSSEARTLVRYNCINNKCVAETKIVECTKNSDCISSSTCDTQSYKCVVIPGGNNNIEVIIESDCQIKALENPWLGYEWVKADTTTGWWLWEKKVDTSFCKATFLTYYIIAGILIFVIILTFILILTNINKSKHKNKGKNK